MFNHSILSPHYQNNRASSSGMTLGDNLSSQEGAPPPPPPPSLPSPSQRSPAKKKTDRKKSNPNVGLDLSALATNGTVAASQVEVVDMLADSSDEEGKKSGGIPPKSVSSSTKASSCNTTAATARKKKGEEKKSGLFAYSFTSSKNCEFSSFSNIVLHSMSSLIYYSHALTYTAAETKELSGPPPTPEHAKSSLKSYTAEESPDHNFTNLKFSPKASIQDDLSSSPVNPTKLNMSSSKKHSDARKSRAPAPDASHSSLTVTKRVDGDKKVGEVDADEKKDVDDEEDTKGKDDTSQM